MSDAIAREVADGMVVQWSTDLGVDLAADAKERIIKAVMAGRLDFAGGLFTYRLIVPVALENGKSVNTLTISEPSGAQIRESSKPGRDYLATAMHLLSGITGQPLAVIDRVKQRDILLLSELIGFFG